mgnify:CR=1 FL=1
MKQLQKAKKDHEILQSVDIQTVVDTLAELPRINNAFQEQILTIIKQEISNLCRRSEPCVLRERQFSGVSNTQWMEDVLEEMKSRCPTLWRMLSRILDYQLQLSNTAPICMIYGIIMFGNCHELSRIQRINSVLLMQGQATKQVQKYHFELVLQIAISGGGVYNTWRIPGY